MLLAIFYTWSSSSGGSQRCSFVLDDGDVVDGDVGGRRVGLVDLPVLVAFWAVKW